MSLFQKSVEKKYLNDLDPKIIEEKYIAYSNHFGNPIIQQNIKESKEEEYQEGFVRDLFVNILDYTLKPSPDYNLVLEQKNVDDSKKADGAIIRDEEVIAVIELKSTQTTDLDMVESQAFGYKNHHPKCTYVITSNFEKIRLYIQNAVEYEKFDLFNLTKEQFALLYLCLSKDNILQDLPLKIKKSSVLQEENVTKKLYEDYSRFRAEIFDNIVKNNPQHNQLVLFRKTQKLLDRFLFIFFAEDRLLLPPNSISEIVKQWTTLKEELDAYVPLYDRFKKYFNYMNTGFKGKKYDIYPYNGGLFLPDDVLDNIMIDDEILHEHTIMLSGYDFETDVDVNILGHIFEHSIAEIENIQAKLRGEEIEKKKTKRKKEGIYYTPKYITKYIVENTVGKLCEEKREELGIADEDYTPNRQKGTKKKLLESLDKCREWLLGITICDPACGSGAFLNQALDFLLNEHHKIDELQAKLLGESIVFSDIEADILERNLYGVDINDEAVEIAKLSLWLRTAKKGRKLSTLSNNIKVGNSLIDDPEVAGEKAFKWEKEFPEIFAKGGFDVVIGNPPYVAKSFSDSIKRYITDNFESAQYQLDLYISFMELGAKIIRSEGILSYIVPNSWLKNLMFDKCRKYMLNNLRFEIIIPNLENIFTDASVDTLIFTSSKSESKTGRIEIGEFINTTYHTKHFVKQSRFLKNDKFIFDVEISVELESIFEKIIDQSVHLHEISDITRGINPYDKYRGQSEEVIKNKAYHSDHIKNSTFVPEIRGKHVHRYALSWDGLSFVSYGDWLAAPREPRFFCGNRIICRQVLSSHLNCTFIDVDFIIDQSVFIAKFNKEQSRMINPKFVLAQLTSKLVAYFFKYKANEFDALFPKIKIGEFRLLPINIVETQLQEEISNKTDLMLELNEDIIIIKQNFLNLLQSKFTLEEPSKRLLNWDLLEFNGFIHELKKIKVRLNLSEEAEWMKYFNKIKGEVQNLKSEIEKTDKELDQMVYELYGLTDDEIEIIEKA